MTRDRIITALAAAAVASGLLVALSADDLGNRPDDGRKHRKGESKVVELDGGKAYVYPTDLEDGGTEFLVTTDAPCRRSLPDAGRCWRRDADGGARDFGAFNRFPVEDMHPSSTHCGSCACSVVSGDDSLEDEDARLVREKARRK